MSTKETLLQEMKQNIYNYCALMPTGQFDPNQPSIKLHEPTTGSDEIFAALETLLSTYTTMGKKVRAFEQQYAQYNATRFGVMSNSGSSANLLSVAALANPLTPRHLCAGDEVIVPALSWSTTIWPLVQHNLVPVFVDCTMESFNLDLQKLEKAITPKTRAIKLVHVYGNPCNMDAILILAQKYNLWIIEDCCEAMGAQYNNAPVGSFGHISNFSFFFSHHISTLEGGISVTNDFELTEMMRILRAHGWSREADEHAKYAADNPDIDPRFIFINQGYNLRPTELNAAMGQHQLPKLDHYIDNRRQTAKYLFSQLEQYNNWLDFQQETPKGKHVWFGFPIIVKQNAPFNVKDLTRHIQSKGIETRPVIAGNMARHPAFKLYTHRVGSDLSTADHIMQSGFALPCHQAVCPAAAEYMAQTITSFIDQVRLPAARRDKSLETA